jgi:cobaltochelatase CobS
MPDFKLDEVTHHMFPKLVAVVNRDVHAYLPGPPGTGKSHMDEQVSRGLGRPFGAMSFHTQSTIASLVGYMDAHGNYVRTVFRDIYEGGGIMLFDEMDGASPAIGIGMNSALANGFMSFPDGMVRRHPDFVAVCTANTLGTGPTAEFAGRQKLDPATLNRFAKIFIDTDENMEDSIVHGMIGEDLGKDWLKKVRHIRRAVAELNIKHFVTMRDSINGARLIAPGDGSFSTLEALEVTILAVLSDDQRDKIRHWRG